jgi:ribosomal protein S25
MMTTKEVKKANAITALELFARQKIENWDLARLITEAKKQGFKTIKDTFSSEEKQLIYLCPASNEKLKYTFNELETKEEAEETIKTARRLQKDSAWNSEVNEWKLPLPKYALRKTSILSAEAEKENVATARNMLEHLQKKGTAAQIKRAEKLLSIYIDRYKIAIGEAENPTTYKWTNERNYMGAKYTIVDKETKGQEYYRELSAQTEDYEIMTMIKHKFGNKNLNDFLVFTNGKDPLSLKQFHGLALKRLS